MFHRHWQAGGCGIGFMDGQSQIIFMQGYVKKNLTLFLVIFVLTTIFFLGKIGKTENYFAQASLWDMIWARVTINPLAVNVSAPAEVEVDKVFKVEAKLINKGEEKIEKAKGEIFLPPGLALLKKDPIQEIGVISPKKEKKIHWSVKGEEIGDYFILVSASGELKGEIIKAEDTTLVKVKKPSPRGKTLEWFQNLFDFFQKRLKF